jgi:hypothetical protein
VKRWQNETDYLVSREISAPTQANVPTTELTRARINARLSQIIPTSKRYRVVYEDVLGEGLHAWHPAPRYPTSSVNCLVWLQLIIAEVYGVGLKNKLPIMDKLRYFGGNVGFSLRKHYVEHWLAIEPDPLKRVTAKHLGATHNYVSTIEPWVFLAHKRFPFPLYQMQRTVFDVEYYEGAQIIQGAMTLPSGYYIMFAVPTDSYLNLYAKRSGPMGLVHGFLVELLGEYDNGRPLDKARVHHASIVAKAVLEEPLMAFLERSRTIHLGYVLYELDPTWRYDYVSPSNEEISKLQELESQLWPNRIHRIFSDFLSF